MRRECGARERTEEVMVTFIRLLAAVTAPEKLTAVLRPASLKMSMLVARGEPSTKTFITRVPTAALPL